MSVFAVLKEHQFKYLHEFSTDYKYSSCRPASDKVDRQVNQSMLFTYLGEVKIVTGTIFIQDSYVLNDLGFLGHVQLIHGMIALEFETRFFLFTLENFVLQT